MAVRMFYIIQLARGFPKDVVVVGIYQDGREVCFINPNLAEAEALSSLIPTTTGFINSVGPYL